MRICFLFVLALLSIVPIDSLADDGLLLFYRDSLLKEFYDVMEDELPALSAVLPNYQRLEEKPGLVIAEFDSETDDNLQWGLAIAGLMRYRLTYASAINVLMPALYSMAEDSWYDGMQKNESVYSLKSLQVLARHWGLDTALTGKVTKNHQRFTISLKRIGLDQGEVIDTMIFDGPSDNLDALIDQAVQWSYESHLKRVEPNLSRYLTTSTPSFSQLSQFAQMITLNWDGRYIEASAIAQELDRNTNVFPEAAAMRIYLTSVGEDIQAHNNTLRNIVTRYPGDQGVKLWASNRFTTRGGCEDYTSYDCVYIRYQADLIEEKTAWAKQVIKGQISAFEPMISLSNWMIDYGIPDRDYGYTAAGLVLAVELLQRWPQQYRSWWAFSYAVSQLAAVYRGYSAWSEVSAKGKRLHGPLLHIANQATDRALALYSQSSNLWGHKVAIAGGYSEDMMSAFRRAVQLNPHNYDAYAHASNFARPRWGGNGNAQMEVYELAVENNPEASWPFDLYRRDINNSVAPGIWVAEQLTRIGCGPDCRDWLLIFCLVLVVLFALGGILIFIR